MSNNKNGGNEFSPELLKSFVDVQKKKIENEGRELAIREKEISSNEKLALKSMELHADLLKVRPKEMRKSITRLAYISMGSLGVILAFIGWLVVSGHKDFANEFMHKASYVIVAGLSFVAGRKSIKYSKRKNNEDDDVQEID